MRLQVGGAAEPDAAHAEDAAASSCAAAGAAVAGAARVGREARHARGQADYGCGRKGGDRNRFRDDSF